MQMMKVVDTSDIDKRLAMAAASAAIRDSYWTFGEHYVDLLVKWADTGALFG